MDYKKAFNSLEHSKIIWKALNELSVPHHFTWLVHNFNRKATGKIRVESDHTEVSIQARVSTRMSSILTVVYRWWRDEDEECERSAPWTSRYYQWRTNNLEFSVC